MSRPQVKVLTLGARSEIDLRDLQEIADVDIRDCLADRHDKTHLIMHRQHGAQAEEVALFVWEEGERVVVVADDPDRLVSIMAFYYQPPPTPEIEPQQPAPSPPPQASVVVESDRESEAQGPLQAPGGRREHHRPSSLARLRQEIERRAKTINPAGKDVAIMNRRKELRRESPGA